MNRAFIRTYMLEQNIPSGNLKAWYNFASGDAHTSGIVYNQIYDINNHYFDSDKYDGDLKSEVLAGIALGDYPDGGIFDYQKLIQPSSEINYNNWTVFLDIESYNQQGYTGHSKILLASMPDSGSSSGFYVGLNGYNKPFMSYASTDGNEYIHTFSREATDRALLSFSFNSDGKSLSIGQHSPKEDYVEKFVTASMRYSNTWTIGGFKDLRGHSPTPIREFWSFDGTLSHFMLFSPSLKGNSPNNFSDFFFLKDYEKGQPKQRLVSTEKNITGAYIGSGVVGTGITGYEKVLINTIDGIGIYANSGVTGEISGEVIKFTNTTTDVNTYESYRAGENKFFDDQICPNFFNKNITLLKNKDAGFSLPANGSLYNDSTRGSISKNSASGYEVRASTRANIQLNKKAIYAGLSGAFVLESGITNKYLNLYRNGLLQRSGTLEEVNATDTDGTGFADYTLVGDMHIYSNNRYINSDLIMYEECDLPNIIGGYTQGQPSSFMYYSNGYVHSTNPYPYFYIDTSSFRKRDLYFGGLKLMSGVDYGYVSSSIRVVYTKNLNNGVFSWVESFDANHDYETGNLKYNISTDKNLMDEIVWLSGIRQRRNVDYMKTAEFSVLHSGYKFNKTPNNYIIYSGQTGFFNI